MPKRNFGIWELIGFGVGIIMTITPEPLTTAVGIGIVGYTAHRVGWL